MKLFIEYPPSGGGGVIGSSLHSVMESYRSVLKIAGKQEYHYTVLIKETRGDSDLWRLRTSLRNKITLSILLILKDSFSISFSNSSRI